MKKLFLIALVTLSLNIFAETDCEKVVDFFIETLKKDRKKILDIAYKGASPERRFSNEQATEENIQNYWTLMECHVFGVHQMLFNLVGEEQVDKLIEEFRANVDPETAFAILKQKAKEACKNKHKRVGAVMLVKKEVMDSVLSALNEKA